MKAWQAQVRKRFSLFLVALYSRYIGFRPVQSGPAAEKGPAQFTPTDVVVTVMGTLALWSPEVKVRVQRPAARGVTVKLAPGAAPLPGETLTTPAQAAPGVMLAVSPARVTMRIRALDEAASVKSRWSGLTTSGCTGGGGGGGGPGGLGAGVGLGVGEGAGFGLGLGFGVGGAAVQVSVTARSLSRKSGVVVMCTLPLSVPGVAGQVARTLMGVSWPGSSVPLLGVMSSQAGWPLKA